MHPIGDEPVKNTGGPVKSHRGVPGLARDRARAASAMV
jgi:hypothetical protein